MMRDFGKPADETGLKQEQQMLPVNEMSENPGEGMRSSHFDQDDGEADHNAAKLIGGAIVGLLIVGGGIYAYETVSATTPAQQVALKTPAANRAALDQIAQPAPVSAAPTTPMTPDTAPASAPPPPVRKSIATAGNTPVVRSEGKGGLPKLAADDPLNAPMTLTPETAPPPQASTPVPTRTAETANPSQTVMQQPVTAPSISVPAGQPMPSMANNDVITGQAADVSRAPTEQTPVPADQAQQPGTQ